MLIERIIFDGYRIAIPIPFPMKYVYCYLFKNDDHYILIDTGLNNDEARETWKEVFKALSINPWEINTIYLTHFHPDHSGLCGWMQELTGAEVLMHPVDISMMERVWREPNLQAQEVGEMVFTHGTPKELSEKITLHMERLRARVLPLPRMTPIGSEVKFAGVSWEIVHTPGHSGGHICFYQAAEGVLISGDHILDKISPNISVWPGASQNPLQEYMHSLLKVRKLNARIALPAHGKLIERVNERIAELISHHEERLAAMERLANEKTVYEIAEKVFADKELTPHQWRFAIAETLAHLEFLTSQGRVVKEASNPVIYKSSF